MGNSAGFLGTLLIKEGHRWNGGLLFERKARQLFCPSTPGVYRGARTSPAVFST
ncbi:hypothetical protein SynRS9915_01318 [Synechococcus sp. RS9915]|nr:hypothetical protein SynRS9915_01318 [Synechococcus sp. RS9915]